MKREECIKSFVNVSEGEVCSLKVAERLGILGDDVQHYNNDFGNVKTYSCVDDGINKPYHLCESDGSPSCLLEEGAGFGFTVHPNDKNICITSECPTGFTEDGDKCIKPKEERNIMLSKRIDERWYDWFMIPNYHLGNKYDIDGTDKKYEPCAKGRVPHFRVDPVDGSVNANEGEFLDKCITKSDYFSGKYNDSPDYCPLAWIIRAGATKENLIKMYRDLIDNVEKKKGVSDELDSLRKSIKNHVDTELLSKINKEGFDEYAGISDTREIEYACQKLASDKTRLLYAYDICNNIKKRGEKEITTEYVNDGMNKNEAKIKYLRACEACHTVFSDPRGTVSQLENKEPIIFENVSNTYTSIQNAQKEREKKQSQTLINSNIEKQFLFFSLKIIAISLFILICIAIIWKTFGKQIVTNIIPMLKKLLRKLGQIISVIFNKQERRTETRPVYIRHTDA